MDKNVLIALGLGAFVMLSCEREIEFDKKENHAQLTTHATIENGEAARVFVSAVVPLYDQYSGSFDSPPKGPDVQGAEISISNGSRTENITIEEYDPYNSIVGTSIWKDGDQLSLRVQHPDYPTLSGTTRFHPKPVVEILEVGVYEQTEYGYTQEFHRIRCRVSNFGGPNQSHLQIKLEGNKYGYSSLASFDPRFFDPYGTDPGEEPRLIGMGRSALFEGNPSSSEVDFYLYASSQPYYNPETSEYAEQDTLRFAYSFLTSEAYRFETSLMLQEANAYSLFSSAVRIPSYLDGGIGIVYTTNSAREEIVADVLNKDWRQF